MHNRMEWIQNTNGTGRVREAARRGLLLRSAELDVPPSILSRLARSGELRRVRRGVYLGASIEPHPLYEAAAAAMVIPRAVVGLLTALEYHGFTTSWSEGIWLLVPRDQNPPKEGDLNVVRVKQDLLVDDLGIDALTVHGVDMRITDPIRTVIDCWRYTRRVSSTVAFEALQSLRHSNAWASCIGSPADCTCGTGSVPLWRQWHEQP